MKKKLNRKEEIIDSFKDTIINVNEVMCERDCFWFEDKYG